MLQVLGSLVQRRAPVLGDRFPSPLRSHACKCALPLQKGAYRPSANRSDGATDRAPAVAETDTGGGAPLRLRPGQSAALAQASRARPAGAPAAGCLFVPTVFPRSNPLIIMCANSHQIPKTPLPLLLLSSEGRSLCVLNSRPLATNVRTSNSAGAVATARGRLPGNGPCLCDGWFEISVRFR